MPLCLDDRALLGRKLFKEGGDKGFLVGVAEGCGGLRNGRRGAGDLLRGKDALDRCATLEAIGMFPDHTASAFAGNEGMGELLRQRSAAPQDGVNLGIQGGALHTFGLERCPNVFRRLAACEVIPGSAFAALLCGKGLAGVAGEWLDFKCRCHGSALVWSGD